MPRKQSTADIDGADSQNKSKARKRGNTEGTIDQRPNGSWRGRIMVGYLPNGKADRRTVSGATRKDVQDKLRALVAQKAEGRLAEKAKEKDTLAEYLSGWLETIPGRVKGSTVYRYRILVNGHIIPCLGAKKLSELKPDAIAAFYAERQKGGLSPTTVQLIHTTLRKALSDAVEYGYIAFNPVARVKPPRRAEFEPRVLTLAWDVVSWERQSIAITRSLSIDADKRAIIDTPKTARGRRVVSLEQDAFEALRRHRARQNADKLKLGPDYADSGLVFASAVGTPMTERNVIREFKEALERAGFSRADRLRIRIHDLRHFHITEAAHAGVSVKALSARVGHASVAFTLDRYAHAIEAGDRDVAAAVSRRLRASQEGEGDAARTGTDTQ